MIYDSEKHCMPNGVAEPVRLPDRTNRVAHKDWMDFSHALTKMLRRTGGGWARKVPFRRITDDAGWASVGDISDVAQNLTGHDKLAFK
eukprot:14988282-Heterocapsa_arctica.AAC.1